MIRKKVKKVRVYYPTSENKDEFERRISRALIKVWCDDYPLEVIDKIIDKLEKENKGA